MGELKDILLNFGAIAGFAGIIGLAVLAMLYFSQARDVRRLREWAGREPERAAEVELRAQQIASQAIAQAYESMAYRQSEADAAAGIASDAGVEVASAPLVPDHPAVLESGDSEQPASQETQAHDVVAHEFGGEDSADNGAAPADAGEQAEPDAGEDQVEQPYEVAAASGGAGETVVHPAPPEDGATDEGAGDQSEPGLPTPSTPAAARAASPLPPLPPLDTSEFTAVRTPATPPVPDYYLTSTTGSGHFEPVERDDDHRSRVPFAVAGVLVAVFAVILIATQLLGGNDGDTTKGSGGSPNNVPQQNTSQNRNQRINRAAVTVAVLNGTDQAGIAATTAAGLNKAGFTDTTTGNLNDGPPVTASTVYYASGAKQEAQEVAKELAIADVKPATDAVIAAGGSVPVIVVLGANFQQ